MQRVFGLFTSLEPLARHSLCCIETYEWVEVAAGSFLVAVEPRTPAVREHLAAAGARLLPSAVNPRVLTPAEAGVFPASCGVSTADTAFSALRKVSQALGHSGFDPEV
jgi:hypothetical protein